ncbi:MAG: Hsp20/alpha crystallin family protein [Steroidobacteraceae bacterium]
MANESASTNGQRTAPPSPGDGGQAGKSRHAIAAGERSGSVAPRERGSGGPTPLARWEQNPFASLWQISREMDRLMDSFFGGGLAGGALAPALEPRFAMSSAWSPQIEIRQRDDSMIIHVDLPGVKPEDVQIEATDDGISISGERQAQREEGERENRRTERTYGSFYRLIALPEGAQTDSIKASMHNGVLEVTVPLAQAKRRRIQIEGGSSRA